MLFTRKRPVESALDQSVFGDFIKVFNLGDRTDQMHGATSVSARLNSLHAGLFSSNVFFGTGLVERTGLAGDTNSDVHDEDAELEIPIFHTAHSTKVKFSRASDDEVPVGDLGFYVGYRYFSTQSFIHYLLRRKNKYAFQSKPGLL